jgi:hypothetical protein
LRIRRRNGEASGSLISAALRPWHAEGRFASRTVIRVIRVQLGLKTLQNPTKIAMPNNNPTVGVVVVSDNSQQEHFRFSCSTTPFLEDYFSFF